jgi:hypothetical protein
VWRACFEEGPQTTFWTHKLEFFPKFKEVFKNNPIVKLRSLGHNSLEYYTYLSSPWPWVIILVNIMGNCPSPQINLFTTCNLGSVVFAWSILSWITQRKSFLDYTNLGFQVSYKLLHDFWCKRCFLNFNLYSLASLLFLSNFDKKSFNDSHTIHFAKTKPLFFTSTLRWCLFLNMLITQLWNTSNV